MSRSRSQRNASKHPAPPSEGATPERHDPPGSVPSCSACIFDTIIAESPDLIAAVDPDFRLLAFNRAYRDAILRLFGLEIAPGMTLPADLVRLDGEGEDGREPWSRAFAGETITLERGFADGGADGEKRPRIYEVRFTPIRDPEGRLLGATQLLHDVTAGKQAAEDLRAAKERLEQRVAERTTQLAESERRYRTVAEHTHDWEFWQAPDKRMLYVSPSCERVTGYTAQEFLADPELVDRIVHPEDRALWIEHRYSRGREGERLPIEFRIVRRDGKERWIAHICQPVTGEDGHDLGRRASNRDISEHKQAEEALLRSERHYRTLFSTMSEGFALHELISDEQGRPRDYRFLEVNTAFEQATGLKAADLLGRTVREVLPNIEPFWIERYGRVAQSGRPDQFESYSAALERWFDVRAFQTEPGRFAVVFMDITRRKATEKALRASEEQTRLLNEQLEQRVAAQTEELTGTVEHLRREVRRRREAEAELVDRSRIVEGFFLYTITPLAVLDRSFNFVRVNRAYASAANREPEFFVGKNHFALYPHPENQAIFEQVVRTHQPFQVQARPFTYPDDPARITYWNWRLTPLLDGQGEVDFLVLNLEDVTAQQQAYQQLQERARQLQSLALDLASAEDRERRRLAEILHDDLQQVLVAARLQLNLLTRRRTEATALPEMVARVDGLLTEAITKSRDLSHDLSPALLYRSSLTATFAWLARQVHARYGLVLHVDSRAEIDTRSEGLKAFLYRAGQELVFNVVKHADVREARLRLKSSGGYLWLALSDRGRGFVPETLSQPAGFGLVNIRERVQLLGGRMRIHSAPGEGSRFVIRVPDTGLAQENAAASARTGGAAPDAGHGSDPVARPPGEGEGPAWERPYRLLLVDDHRVMREGLAALLAEQRDIEVVGQAGNGREGVDLAYRLRPEIVIMDVSMPVMAGDEATRQIRHHLPGTRVIALSMFEEAELLERMLAAGAEVYLPKAGPAENLLAAIRKQPARGASPASGQAD